MSLRLGLVQINVPEIKKARKFYEQVLGLRCRQPEGHACPLEFDLGNGNTLLLYVAEKLAGATYETQRVTIVLFTDNLEKRMAEWRKKGVKFVRIPWSTVPSGVGGSPYGPFIAFKDPFGNTWELLQPHKAKKSPVRSTKRARK